VVELDNGTRFFSNFRYNRAGGDDENPKFESDCSKTMVGFVQQTGPSEGSMTKYPV